MKSILSLINNYNNDDDDINNGNNDLEETEADECVIGPTKQAKFGNKILMFDFNGDGKRDMVISSEHSSLEAR